MRVLPQESVGERRRGRQQMDSSRKHVVRYRLLVVQEGSGAN
jgi:hypothetical protein